MAVAHPSTSSATARSRSKHTYHCNRLAAPGIFTTYANCSIIVLVLLTCTLLWRTPTSQQQSLSSSTSTWAFQSFVVRNSTIPSAGLGAFATVRIPAGALWAPEVLQPGAVLYMPGHQWTALLALAEHFYAAGERSHPYVNLVMFLITYGFHCPNNSFAVELTGTAFVNHAPKQAPDMSATSGTTGSTSSTRTSQHHKITKQYANVGDPEDESGKTVPGYPPSKTPAKLVDTLIKMGLSPGINYDISCVIAPALRDIQAGEEILEDYREFYCDSHDNTCEEYVFDEGLEPFVVWKKDKGSPTASGRLPGRRHPLVQLPLVKVKGLGTTFAATAASSSMVVAAMDLPAGSVWNDLDADFSLEVTRNQWDHLMKMQDALERMHTPRQVVQDFVNAIKVLGRCCPHSNSLFIPLTTSTFAGTPEPSSGNKPSDATSMASHPEVLRRTPRLWTSHKHNSASDAQADHLLHVRQLCTWSSLQKAAKAGEELVHSQPVVACEWPGFAK